ncbi:MATE family efflux transporter [Vibrio sonorensis]|uniref:MATE family efflux transporter n=1 Tax=Vibrio sonorensis TaxID=1004316 RepID=UPI000A040C8B|nr:MATE family efflux transporter [Vibrio sonorensis]
MFKNAYIRKNVAIAWPLALNALLMQSMLMIDTFLVSPLGEVSLAALGISSTIIAFLLGIQMALANGSQLVLSRAVGSGQSSKLAKGFWSALVINTCSACIGWLVIVFAKEQLVSLLTSEKVLADEINQYLSIAKYLILVNGLTQVFIALFNALGRTKVPFIGYLIELPVNAASSYLLIHGAHTLQGMGVQGAAVGSLIAICLRFLYLFACLKEQGEGRLNAPIVNGAFINSVRLHFQEVFPVAVNITILQVGATIYMLLYSQLDINAYVAITLVMPWIRSGTQFITAWAHSSAISISQALGAGQLKSLEKDIDVSIDISVWLSIATALFFLLLSLVLPDFYPDLDKETYHALTLISPLYILLPIVRGYNTVHGHVLRALGKTKSVFLVNFSGQWVISLPLCMLVVFYLELSFFWAFAVMPFEEIVKALPFRYLARKSIQEFNQKKASALMYD